MAEQESNQCTYYCSFNTFRAGCIESSVGQYPLSELSIGHTIISSPAECIYAIYLYRYPNCSRRLAGPGLVTRSDRCTILCSASKLGSNRSLHFTTNGASQPVPTSYSRISDLLYYLLSCHFVSGRAFQASAVMCETFSCFLTLLTLPGVQGPDSPTYHVISFQDAQNTTVRVPLAQTLPQSYTFAQEHAINTASCVRCLRMSVTLHPRPLHYG